MNIFRRTGCVFYNRILFPLYQRTIGFRKKKKEVKTKYRIQKGRRNVVIIGVPNHGNLGDYAIFEAEKNLLHRYCPNANIFGVNMTDFQHEILQLKKLLGRKDLIILTGGGNLGNQYPDDEKIRRRTIQLFPQNRIVLFPQTMYFTNDAEGENEKNITAEIYNRHKRLILFARDRYSYEEMKKLFTVPVKLMPDVVLTWDAIFSKNQADTEKREGALLLLRQDVEKKLTTEQEKELKERLRGRYSEVKATDTEVPYEIFIRNSQKCLQEKIAEVRSAELVVTDRLHGMVFAAITATPCLVIGNYNHKVKETYGWVSHLPYIRYLTDWDQLDEQLTLLEKYGKCKYEHSEITNLYDEVMQEIIYG